MQFKIFKKDSNDLGIGIFSSSKYLSDLHHHVEYEITYIAKGTGYFQVENKQIPVAPGTIVVVEPNTNHCLRIENKDLLYYTIVFNLSAIGSDKDCCRKILDLIKIKETVTLPDEYITQLIDISQTTDWKKFGREFKLKTLLFQIITHIIETKQYMQYTKALNNMDSHSKSVLIVCKYIQQHCTEKIDYEDLLNQSNYSKSQFIKIFKKETCMNITDYINQCRIENACLDLLKTNKNITEIAIENGFNNVQYFSKRFKEAMNCTPKEYKTEYLKNEKK